MRFMELLLEVCPTVLRALSLPTLMAIKTQDDVPVMNIAFAAGSIGSIRLIEWIVNQSTNTNFKKDSIYGEALQGARTSNRVVCYKTVLASKQTPFRCLLETARLSVYWYKYTKFARYDCSQGRMPNMVLEVECLYPVTRRRIRLVWKRASNSTNKDVKVEILCLPRKVDFNETLMVNELFETLGNNFQKTGSNLETHTGITLVGGITLDIRYCNEMTITDAAFKHLNTLTKLDMSECNQTQITDQGFNYLSNLAELDMGKCNQSTLTDTAFKHLKTLTKLCMDRYDQTQITDQGFNYLSSLTDLNMNSCNQSTITDAAFEHLATLTK